MMTIHQNNLKIAHWNVGGMRLSSSDPKIEDHRFIEIIKKHDIICLTETHCGDEDKIVVQGYKCFQLCRSKTKKSNRHHGGIAILFKECIATGLKFLNHKNNDYIWVKLCKNFFNSTKDIYMCAAYIPPENSPFFKSRGENTLEYIENDLLKYCNMGSILLVGDLNARTGTELDFIVNDNDKYFQRNNEFYLLDKNAIERNSQDKTVCKRGRALINMCTSAQVRFLNGRFIGDIRGQFTCHKYNGSSVVDYAITDEANMKNILYFQVFDFIGDLSDHCCISFSLKCNFVENISNPFYKAKAFPPSYKWDTSCIIKYQSIFTNTDMTKRIKDFLSSAELYNDGINKTVEKVTNMYTDSAKSCLKQKRYKSHNVKHTRKHKPWFDNNLKRMRIELDKIGKVLHYTQHIPETRRVFFRTLKLYNKQRKIAHRQFTQNMMTKLDNLRSADPQAYWKLLKAMKGDVDNPSENIKLDDWELYFKELNKSPTTNKNDLKVKLADLEGDKCFNEMDFQFTEKEVSRCIKKLKNNKSAGLDGISNEMIKYSQHIMLPVLTKLFNMILVSKQYPKQWCDGYIVPISKGADTSVPSNYRGITILSSVAKLFNSLLNERLSKFLEKKDTLDKKQIGFKKGFRTTDHMFTLRTLIEKYIKTGKLYACFVDFKKAFDSIDHVSLLYKLKQLEVGSNFYYLIKDMYVNIGSTLYVKSGGYLSRSFHSYIGLRQGDVLSPNLFKIYLNDLGNYIKPDNDTPFISDTPIEYLLYADDLVLFSRSEKGLQNSLNKLTEYCKVWNLTINLDKTKVLIFNKTGKLIKNNLHINGKKIESTKTYKYLGLIFSVSGKFTEAKNDLLNRGFKAMFKLTSMFKNTNPSFQTCMHLFDHIIKPVLLYGSEIWADYSFSNIDNLYNALKHEIVEQCHIKYCRFILGVNKKAPNLGVYGDTGRYPMSISATISVLKYWHRLINIHSDNFSILHNAYLCNLNECDIKQSWSSHIRNMLEFLSLNNSKYTQSKAFYTNILHTKLKEIFTAGWKKELFSDTRKKNHGNKLRTYRTFKSNFGTEAYLFNCNNSSYRKCLARFRLSAHNLNIERLRYVYPRVPPEDRICNQCSKNECEDEFHFVMKCDKYNVLRKDFFDNLVVLCKNFHDMDDHKKFMWICSSKDGNIIKLLGNFISTCFNNRNT